MSNTTHRDLTDGEERILSGRRISVVIPVYNDIAHVGAAVSALLEQTLAPTEIVVVDDGSTDASAAAVEAFADRVIYVWQPNAGPAAARNHGIRVSTGDLVAFTDSDCLPARDWLARLAAGFDTDHVAGVGGPVRAAEAGLVAAYADDRGLLDPKRAEDGSVEYLITANACFRRHALIEAGLFSELFRRPGGEELDLCRRIRSMGYELRAVDDALVLHHHRASVRELLLTIANYGEGHYVLGQLWPELKLRWPFLGLVRGLLALHAAVRRTLLLHRKHREWRKACTFALLDYLYLPAFLAGYLRGRARRRRRRPATAAAVSEAS